MFRVSFDIEDKELPSVVANIGGRIPLTILPLPPHNESAVTTKPASNAKAATSSRPKKRRLGRPHATFEGGKTALEVVRGLIDKCGIPPFHSLEIVKKADSMGISNPNVYRALRMECEAGRLRKVDAGVYQRTGQGWAENIGVAANS